MFTQQQENEWIQFSKRSYGKFDASEFKSSLF